jgi:NACHT domain
MVRSIQHKATFILTIQKLVCRDFQSAQNHPYRFGSNEGLHALSLAISDGAIHDSAERYPPPNCHPDTRKAVRQIIVDWIHKESSASLFFWLYGPAGAGKTAILQAIAEFMSSSSETDENFGGSFFFSRGKNGRDQGRFLFSTIAYQLALNVPGLRQHVNRIMEANPRLHTKSMAIQLQTLIVDAFQCLSPLPQRSYLVIIDGLDECHDKATQQSILQLLCKTSTDHELPLRFLIGSRPESHIRSSFDHESLYAITRRVVLDEKFDPGRDIWVFLQDGFAKIYAQNPILSRAEHSWPGEGIIDLLVQRSSGQFIYAATVLKFVGADFCNPMKQLALVLKPDPTAFSDLDQLYTQILSVYPSTVNIVQVLGIIVAFTRGDLTPVVIEDIFEMEEGELKLVLRGLSSLIAFKGDKNGEYLTGSIVSNVGRPYFLHASFGDFLEDSTRSGPFHVDKQVHKNQGTIRSFAMITQSIASSWR